MPCGPYYRKWKANARGVDLNRNFQAFWEEYQDLKGQPSREGYKGRAPEDQEESKALAELTRQQKFQRTVSYHSSGEVIYWDFGQKGEFRKICRNFGERIRRITGYGLPEGWDHLDPAGYKDWAVKERKIPSLTIEIGKAESPLPPSAFREILRRNRGGLGGDPAVSVKKLLLSFCYVRGCRGKRYLIAVGPYRGSLVKRGG